MTFGGFDTDGMLERSKERNLMRGLLKVELSNLAELEHQLLACSQFTPEMHLRVVTARASLIEALALIDKIDLNAALFDRLREEDQGE